MGARPPGSTFLVAGAVLLALAAGPAVREAAAQTASQVTPQSFRPDLRPLDGAVVFSGAPGLAAPEAAYALSVAVGDVTVEGGVPEMAAAERRLERRLVGRRVPVAEVFAAAQDLEAAYAEAGYVLNRIVVPAQTLRDGGELRLVVVRGFIERLETEGVPETARPRVEQIAAPLVGQQGLKLTEIERRVLLAGDIPGLALDTALARGRQSGGTALAFQGRFRGVTGFAGFDTTLSDELGGWALSAGLEANGYLGLGEVLYLSAAGHPGGDGDDGYGAFLGEYPRLRSFAGGFVVPLGRDGLSFNLEAVRSKTTPEIDEMPTASEFERLSLRLLYPWVRSRRLDVSTELTFDATSERLDLLDGDLPLSEDRLRVLRLGIDGRRQLDDGAVVSGRALLSFGLDALGARSSEDATDTLPLSRQGADAEFTKLELAASYTTAIHEHVVVSVSARGQTSFGDPLLRSEQIGIASFGELSTFDAGTLGGDSGWSLRGDVLLPRPIAQDRLPFDQVTPYAFAALGQLYLEEPTVFEEETLGVASLGVGLELTRLIDPDFSNASLTMEFGRAFRDDDLEDEYRFTMLGSIRF